MRSRWEMPIPSPNIESDGRRYYVCSQHRKCGPCEHVRLILWDHLCILSAGQLSQHSPSHRCPYPSCRKLRVSLLPLRSHEEAPQLLRDNPHRTRSAKRVEDQVPLPAGGHDCPPYQAQGLLGGMVAVELLLPGHGRYGLDGGDLGGGVSAVYEVVVEGVAGASLARPEQCLVGVGEGGVEGVRGWVRFRPRDLIYEPQFHGLQGETEAEDDVVRARDPDGAAGPEDAARFLEPPDVEPVVPFEPHRANRVTTPGPALSGAAERRRPRTRSPEVGERHLCNRRPICLGRTLILAQRTFE